MSTMKAAMAAFPEYRSIKTVWALEIQSVESYSDGDWMISFVQSDFGPRLVQKAGKPVPEPGWYWVQYEGGYESFSPKEAFENGNILKADLVVLAAQDAHEANRILCLALGDASQVHWEECPQWQKESVVSGVLHIMNHPATTPEQSHESWLQLKKNTGWVWGPVRDVEKKEHPCMLPYSQLPENQRLKDELFGLVVRSILFP